MPLKFDLPTSAIGDPDTELSHRFIEDFLYDTLAKLGPRKRVCLVPPDFTRFHSQAGLLTSICWKIFGKAVKAVIPALGTHRSMTTGEKALMFPDIPDELFFNHNWRTGVTRLGTIPADFISRLSEGRPHFPIAVELNSFLLRENFDCILSIGQVVPHEVAGMANHSKNILVGLGGAEFINVSHFLGALCGIETIMGRIENPVRKLFSKAAADFLDDLPIVYLLNVMENASDGRNILRGLFAGTGQKCFRKAAQLSQKVNINTLDRPLKRCVVYLDPKEYHSTWLGNKAIYRTRMAMADNGELLILAPGLDRFGEDRRIDALIRQFGYKGTAHTLDAVLSSKELSDNLSAAAHLIHGSSEGRFTITYATSKLAENDLRSVGYEWDCCNEQLGRYESCIGKTGWHADEHGPYYFISNPALGLWTANL